MQGPRPLMVSNGNNPPFSIAAAETYFGKNANQLDVGDAAFLAGLIRSPGIYDGFGDVEIVGKRRSMSLQSALDAEIISIEERDRFEQRGLPDRNLSLIHI